MRFKPYLYLVISLFYKDCVCFPAIASTPKSGGSLLSLQNVDRVVDSVLPLFLKGPRDVEGRAHGSLMLTTLKDLKETLSKSAKSKEGWTSFGKRALTYFLSGKKALESENEVDTKLAHELYEKSPQFVKDSVKAQLGGGVMPILEEKVKNLIQTIKERQATSSDGNLKVEGKQTPFDPLVFGVNAFINMFWFTTVNGYLLQNMGLENLFNPDFDYDYSQLEEGGEHGEGEEEEEGEGEEGEGEEGENGEGGSEDEAAHGEGAGLGGGHADQPQQNTMQHDTYSHYPGQRMKLSSPALSNHIHHPAPNYHYFKLYKPEKGRRG